MYNEWRRPLNGRCFDVSVFCDVMALIEKLCRSRRCPLKVIPYGQNAIMLPGIHVGDGAIIGMNDIVANNVEPYSIVGQSRKDHSKEI